jgi:hypothetical protein
MDMAEYQRIMRKGDGIFLAGGLLFVANLAGLLLDPLTMASLPVGIIIMGYGAHIQYDANEKLKNEILLAISQSQLKPGDEVSAVMGRSLSNDSCPQCGYKESK